MTDDGTGVDGSAEEFSPEEAIRRAWSCGTGGPRRLSAEEKRAHPASRRGTGRRIVWRNEIHLVSRKMRCFRCGWYRDEFYGGDCVCRACFWINISELPPSAEELWLEMGGGFAGPKKLPVQERMNHPASRAGTGRAIIWQGERHVVSPSMRCFVCGWYQDEFYGEDCACGACVWTKTSPEPPGQERHLDPAAGGAGHMASAPLQSDDGPRALGTTGDRRLIVDQYLGSAVATALGGIARGMVVMLVGAAGVGKSTLAAQAGYTIARQLRARLYWLDADQLKEELIEEAFVRAQCPPGQLEGGIIPIHEEDEDGIPDFRRACAKVPVDGVLVVDSLEAWAPRGDKQALELLRVLRAHPARVKLVVAATNAAGSVAGRGELERAGDATVFVEQHQIRVGKCRWTIGATWARCGPGGLDVARASDRGDVAEPATQHRGAASPQAMGAEPDFSVEFIDQAARWSVREVEEYRTRLRAQGVPRDSIAGWDRAVDERKAQQAERPAGARPTQAGDEASLSDGTRAAYAALVRFWPWTTPVRASDIAQSLLALEFEELGNALRALLGAGDGKPLRAIEVGNALKVVRDVDLNGMKLTRELDRKGIAHWRLQRPDAA